MCLKVVDFQKPNIDKKKQTDKIKIYQLSECRASEEFRKTFQMIFLTYKNKTLDI